MIQNFISKGKSVFSVFKRVLTAWRDLIFPPLCVHCKEQCETKFFCSSCWELCSLAEPREKCPHCFKDVEGLCGVCRRNPLLSFTRACVFEDTEPARILAREEEEILAPFVMAQWSQLDWPVPDVIIPMPGNKKLAYQFSEMLRRPMADILWEEKGWRCDAEAVIEDQIILLIDFASSIDSLQGAVGALAAASPKRGYLLSFFIVV